MRIAVNGAGIAGPTLAYWLNKSGHEALLVEEAPGSPTSFDFQWSRSTSSRETSGTISPSRTIGSARPSERLRPTLTYPPADRYCEPMILQEILP